MIYEKSKTRDHPLKKLVCLELPPMGFQAEENGRGVFLI